MSEKTWKSMTKMHGIRWGLKEYRRIQFYPHVVVDKMGVAVLLRDKTDRDGKQAMKMVYRHPR